MYNVVMRAQQVTFRMHNNSAHVRPRVAASIIALGLGLLPLPLVLCLPADEPPPPLHKYGSISALAVSPYCGCLPQPLPLLLTREAALCALPGP